MRLAWLLCAWVLWAQSTATGVAIPGQAWETRKECEDFRIAREAALRAAFQYPADSVLRCLPDTVDPTVRR